MALEARGGYKGDLVLCDKSGAAVKIYSYGSEEQQRYEQVIDILREMDRKILQELTEKREAKRQVLSDQIEPCDKKIVRRAVQRSTRRYNLTQAAFLLGVHRQTIYYWIKTGKIRPKRDHRNYPVFTVLDIEGMIKWMNTLSI